MKKIKVLIIDDSAVVRQILTKILSSDDSIEVVGSAMDPHLAREKIKRLNPDVLTLDVEMPKMDGISFLRSLMRLRPMPVVMVSTLTEKGADITLEALELGAVDFVSKPKVDIANTLGDYAEEIITKVKTAANARVQLGSKRKFDEIEQELGKKPFGKDLDIEKKFTVTTIIKRQPITTKLFKTTDKIIAIGASTGGTEAIKEILEKMPPDTPGTVITQHIPPVFSTSFARRMNDLSNMTVMEAQDGQQIIPGHVYIAPGDKHLMVVRDGVCFRCKLSDGPPVNRHIPSVDVLFRSVAQNVGSNVIGVVLTGMGADGARGLKEIRDAGGFTIAQDEKTSVVWGMPGEAVKLGGAEDILPIYKIQQKIDSILREETSGA